MTNGYEQKNVEVKSLSETRGIYVWIHDGKLKAGGVTLNEKFREIFEIEQKKQQRMRPDDGRQMFQKYCLELFGGNQWSY
jgi:hypothetical protein